jgi:hypothetical protein
VRGKHSVSAAGTSFRRLDLGSDSASRSSRNSCPRHSIPQSVKARDAILADAVDAQMRRFRNSGSRLSPEADSHSVAAVTSTYPTLGERRSDSDGFDDLTNIAPIDIGGIRASPQSFCPARLRSVQSGGDPRQTYRLELRAFKPAKARQLQSSKPTRKRLTYALRSFLWGSKIDTLDLDPRW